MNANNISWQKTAAAAAGLLEMLSERGDVIFGMRVIGNIKAWPSRSVSPTRAAGTSDGGHGWRYDSAARLPDYDVVPVSSFPRPHFRRARVGGARRTFLSRILKLLLPEQQKKLRHRRQ